MCVCVREFFLNLFGCSGCANPSWAVTSEPPARRTAEDVSRVGGAEGEDAHGRNSHIHLDRSKQPKHPPGGREAEQVRSSPSESDLKSFAAWC